MRRVTGRGGRLFAVLLAIALMGGCSTNTESPDSVAEPNGSAVEEAAGRTATVVRRDLTLSFTLEAVTSGVPESIDVAATLTPIQYLRFISRPFTGKATVETVMGQRQFACKSLLADQADATEGEAVATLRCRIPAAAETVQGLRARLSITSDTVKNVLVVPNLFIGYDEQRNGYYVNLAKGDKTAVEVGVTDGVVRVITAGVNEDDILAPIAAAP